jgi:predicted amidohydrolase YtcJ
VTSYRPLDTIGAAIQRQTRAGRDIGAAESITLDEALRAHTISAAYALRMEDRLGSLETGKLADLAIVDGDLTTTPVDALASLGNWLTVIGGRAAYAADQSALP